MKAEQLKAEVKVYPILPRIELCRWLSYKTVSKMCFWLNEKKGNGDPKFSGNAFSWWWPFTQECSFSSLKDPLGDRAELLAIVSNRMQSQWPKNWKIILHIYKLQFSGNFHILFHLYFHQLFIFSLFYSHLIFAPIMNYHSKFHPRTLVLFT